MRLSIKCAKKYAVYVYPKLSTEFCAESGYEQYIRELGDEERLDNLAEFKRIASEFERNMGEDLSAEEFFCNKCSASS